jgi:hypothetical protein
MSLAGRRVGDRCPSCGERLTEVASIGRCPTCDWREFAPTD